MIDPNDLRAFKGPRFKQPSGAGGTGQKKAKKPQSVQFIAAKSEKTARKKKCVTCRTCPNPHGYRIEPHHIVHRSHLGGNDMWHLGNIMGLCLECHTKYHAGDAATKEAIRKALTQDEIDYADSIHHEYIDKNYFRLPRTVAGQTAVWEAAA